MRASECLLIFLSGRRVSINDVGASVEESAGEYGGTFTRWFCHEEMNEA